MLPRGLLSVSASGRSCWAVLLSNTRVVFRSVGRSFGLPVVLAAGSWTTMDVLMHRWRAAFIFLGGMPKCVVAGPYGKYLIGFFFFLKKLPDCLLKCLYYFTFLPEIHRRSGFSEPPSASYLVHIHNFSASICCLTGCHVLHGPSYAQGSPAPSQSFRVHLSSSENGPQSSPTF